MTAAIGNAKCADLSPADKRKEDPCTAEDTASLKLRSEISGPLSGHNIYNTSALSGTRAGLAEALMLKSILSTLRYHKYA